MGRRVDALVEQLDLFATVVAAAGAPPSQRAFARSLLPLARGTGATGEPGVPGAHVGSGAPERDAVFSELKREIMVRTMRHKYVVDARGRGFQLFDLQEDPREQRNLVGHPDYVGVERDLRERILTWLVSTQVISTD